MKLHNTKYAPLALLTAVVLTVAGCSTQKNTAKSRWWHSFTARYNTYYNGSVAYIDGSLEKETGNKDNYTEIIPLYTVGNKDSRDLGKSYFERAIEKSQKAIKLHSIKRKPEWNKSRRKTEKDIEWLGRKEYNPFLWKAWMLMGRSQFHKGDFDEAASTFSYMSRLYQTQPAIYGKARAWLAKCYIEEGWLYDAEDVMRNMSRDSIHWQARKEWDYTYADYYIHTGEYEKAIPYLRKVIKHEMRRKQRAREWFLMGQLQNAIGNKIEATKAYKRVIRQSPPYELEFNSRIALTEVMSEGQSKKMISRLKRMARSDKNKDYLDQVYYAIGNIYLNQKDTANAISAYEKGAEKATRSGIEKGVLLLKLGDIYWIQEKYKDAGRCYGEAIGLLDTDRKDYEQLSERSKVLDELVPHTDAIHLQDSLQALAKMSEEDRNAAIDRVIEALKKKEKEEADREVEARAQETIAQNSGTSNRNTSQTTSTESGTWYFYNPTAVSQGKETFRKQWGNRQNVDDWQRSNRTVVASVTEEEELSEEQLDSIAHAEALNDSLSLRADSAQNDPHKREYYLAQIPFTEEQVAASNKIIKEALYNAGVIFKDKLNNLPRSEKMFLRLTEQYPDYEQMDNAYYHMFLLYSRMGMHDVANTYVNRLVAEFPESQWTVLLTDPYFEENARFGVHMEDSLYAATYDAFKADRFSEVRGNLHISETRFPLGANRDKFIFIGGLSKLNSGSAEACVADMKTIVEKYPQSELCEMAGMILNGVSAGRTLHGGKFGIGDVWARRSEVLNTGDSLQSRELTNDRNIDFVFMFAYQPDSIDENRLLYDVARYNFTSYMVRNFDVVIEEAAGLNRMMISGFRNYDEALQYARQLHSQQNIKYDPANCRSIIISEQNLPLLGTQFSYDDYDEFYNIHFAPLEISTAYLLGEPAEITTKRGKKPTVEDIDDWLDNSLLIDNGLDIDIGPDEGTTIEDETSTESYQESTLIIDDNETTTTTETFVNEETIDEAQGGDSMIITPDETDEGQSTEVPPTEETVTDTDNENGVAPEEETIPVSRITADEEQEDAIQTESEQQENNTFFIPDEETEQTSQDDNATQQDVYTPELEAAEPKQQPQQTEATSQESKEEQIEEVEEAPQKAETEEPVKQKTSEELEDEFYFDDDFGTTQKTQSTTTKSTTTYEIDDEYYDLDGF